MQDINSLRSMKPTDTMTFARLVPGLRLSMNSKQSFINGVNKPFMGLFLLL